MDGNPGQATVACLKCGSRVPSGARFCPVCGAVLNTVPAQPTPTTPRPAPDYGQPPGYGQPPTYSQPPTHSPIQGHGSVPGYSAGYGYAPAPAHRSTKPLWVVLGAIGLGVVIVAGALLVSVAVGSHDNSSPSPIAPATRTLTPTPAPHTSPPSVAPTSPPSGTFTRTGDPMTDSLGFAGTVTLLTDGRVLFAGGWSGGDDSYTPSATAQLYDPKTGTFSLTGAMTVPRARHTATLLTDGRVLITGGVSQQNSSNTGPYLASAELYDPQSGIFTAAGSTVHARANHTATLLADGRVLLVGGNSDADRLATAELYDPQTSKFTAIGSVLSGLRSFHTATTLADGRVLIAGGRDLNHDPVASAELYDPTTGKFSKTGSMETSRGDPALAVLPDGHVLVVGGDASAELYDPSSGAFSLTGSLLNGPISAVRLQDGRVLVIEGGRVAELYQP